MNFVILMDSVYPVSTRADLIFAIKRIMEMMNAIVKEKKVM
jgi:hypothetical protein